MILNPCPSKITFRRLLKKAIINSEPFKTVLDCASAGDKFLSYFPGKEYYSVDKNAELIKEAIHRNADNCNCHFICDNLLFFERLDKDRQYGLVVSTHTLSHIAESDKNKVLTNLVNKVGIGGSFILQCSADELSYVSLYVHRFDVVVNKLYRGMLTLAFERFLFWVYDVGTIEKLGNEGRLLLYQKTRMIVLLLSFFVSFFDCFFSPKSCVIHFKNKIKV